MIISVRTKLSSKQTRKTARPAPASHNSPHNPEFVSGPGLTRELEGRNEILWGVCFSQRHRHQNRCLSWTLIGSFQFMACLKSILHFCLFIFRPFFPDMMEKKIRFLQNIIKDGRDKYDAECWIFSGDCVQDCGAKFNKRNKARIVHWMSVPAQTES